MIDDKHDMDLSVVIATFRGMRMPLSISNQEARVMYYCNDLFERLELVGCLLLRKSN